MSQTDPEQRNGDAQMKRRYDKFKNGTEVHLYGPLLSAGFTQSGRCFFFSFRIFVIISFRSLFIAIVASLNRALPSLSRVKIKFTKSDRGLHVVKYAGVTDDYMLHMTDLRLCVKRLV